MFASALRTAAFVMLLQAVAVQDASADESPRDVINAIANACSERRFSDVGPYLHPKLRRTWIEIGYKVKDFCELLTRSYTLSNVRIDKEELVGEHAVVFVTYVFSDRSEQSDRAVLLKDRRMWKLAG